MQVCHPVLQNLIWTLAALCELTFSPMITSVLYYVTPDWLLQSPDLLERQTPCSSSLVSREKQVSGPVLTLSVSGCINFAIPSFRVLVFSLSAIPFRLPALSTIRSCSVCLFSTIAVFTFSFCFLLSCFSFLFCFCFIPFSASILCFPVLPARIPRARCCYSSAEADPHSPL